MNPVVCVFESDMESIGDKPLDEVARTELQANAKRGQFDVITSRLLADLAKAMERHPDDSKNIDAIIARTKALEFHDSMNLTAMIDLLDAIVIDNLVPAHFNQIYCALMNCDYVVA
jgi:hypothetical protein